MSDMLQPLTTTPAAPSRALRQEYAPWLTRVDASFSDGIVIVAGLVVGFIGTVILGADPVAAKVIGGLLMVAGYGAALAYIVWETILVQGRTGASRGKRGVDIQVVDANSLQPIGPGRTLVRILAHVVDVVPVLLGLLWPAWDAKHQSFADKITGTLVIVTAPDNVPGPAPESSWYATSPAASKPPAYLSVRDLYVHFPTPDGIVKATEGLSYDLERGKTLGIVGESGSGKSVSSSAILGLHRGTNALVSGEILLDGVDLLQLDDEQMRRRRGRDVSMIFQDPLSAMHPYYTVGNQIAEAYLVHHDVSKKAARQRTIEMLDRVGIPQPDRRVDDYPHQFSGGMRQRAMIAMSLMNDPGLLIADEPTTALDVTVQAQILDLLQDLQREFNSAIVIITHDLGVVAEMADDVLVMYAGRAVEYGPTREILVHPEMPYTWGLLSSVPDVVGDTDAKLIPIRGNPPSLLSPPPGCAFNPRCDHRDKVPGDLCITVTPELTPAQAGGNHTKRCHLANPDAVYASEILPEIAPELAQEHE